MAASTLAGQTDRVTLVISRVHPKEEQASGAGRRAPVHGFVWRSGVRSLATASGTGKATKRTGSFWEPNQTSRVEVAAPAQFGHQIQRRPGAGIVESHVRAAARHKEGADLGDPLEGAHDEVTQITNDEIARLGDLQDIQGGSLVITGKAERDRCRACAESRSVMNWILRAAKLLRWLRLPGKIWAK